MNFEETFKSLTGNHPFPWQTALYERFISGRTDNIPASCNLPTGLGKTSVVAVWLIALAERSDLVPRRLVYVVNRRTVVDQTTTEVENYRCKLEKETEPALSGLRQRLIELCAFRPDLDGDKSFSPLAISTLRGQFADNREWSADPVRPAVIVGTVDMIGSRLLFSGYGIGFKSKPLHAGFLGQDALIVHDEAHLEPAFQKLIESVEAEQLRSNDVRKLRVMELSATSRAQSNQEPFGLTKADFDNSEVRKRIEAKKKVILHELADEKKLPETIANLAKAKRTENCAVLIFVRKVEDVEKIVKLLPKGKTQLLTGTLRGLERDQMADPRRREGCPIFARFLKPPPPTPDERDHWKVEVAKGTVFLVCTSAGEVGVNISADHMICDLSTFESMAQRFGRVNRFGDRSDTTIDVVYPAGFDEDYKLEKRRLATLKLLVSLRGDGSPKSLGELDSRKRIAAYAPDPEILQTSNILFDAWAMTSIQGKLPGRPPVEPYLHGISDRDPPQTAFAWREEVALLTGVASASDIEEALDYARIKPHELLRVPTFGRGRAYEQLRTIARRVSENLPIWIVEPDGSLITNKTISEIVEKRGAEFIVPLAGRTVVLPPKAGGLTDLGMFDGGDEYAVTRDYDVFDMDSEASLLRFIFNTDSEGNSWLTQISKAADFLDKNTTQTTEATEYYQESHPRLRLSDKFPFRTIFSLKLTTTDDEETGDAKQEYLILKHTHSKTLTPRPPEWPALSKHLENVSRIATAISKCLNFDENLTRAVELSAAWHDLGKARSVWQRGAGNDKTHLLIAKTLHGRPPENLSRYRHELGSLIDVFATDHAASEIAELSEEHQDLVLHLIACHHGRARPYFPEVESHDIETHSAFVEWVVKEVPLRFARLQRRYGRWGLAYLESILRSADILDSQRLEGAPLDKPLLANWPKRVRNAIASTAKPNPVPNIRINLDLTNPGQYFACCGLLEFADRLWPGAMAWFENDVFCISCAGTLREILAGATALSVVGIEEEDEPKEQQEGDDDDGGCDDDNSDVTPVEITFPVVLRLDWWSDKSIKTWAGRMNVHKIAIAMAKAIDPESNSPFSQCEVVFDPQKTEEGVTKYRGAKRNKREPFYFDALRGPNSHARDIGFSPNDLKLTTTASPVIEFFCLVGLQRCRPALTSQVRLFTYFTWHTAIEVSIVPAAVNGLLPLMAIAAYQFQNVFRSGQKKHKTFMPATQLPLESVNND